MHQVGKVRHAVQSVTTMRANKMLQVSGPEGIDFVLQYWDDVSAGLLELRGTTRRQQKQIRALSSTSIALYLYLRQYSHQQDPPGTTDGLTALVHDAFSDATRQTLRLEEIALLLPHEPGHGDGLSRDHVGQQSRI